MSGVPRPKLTVRQSRVGLLDETEDGPLELALHDFALPCRRFSVDHKIAEVGKVSVTAEFLLRFVKSAEYCSEEAVQTFFGYSRRELAYVLREVEEADFVERAEGRLSLTPTGHGLFRSGTEEPAIYEIERRSARVGFDLLSLAPEERRFLSRFEMCLPELPLRDTAQVSGAAERVRTSFRRYWREISTRIDPTATPARSLYSIDAVTAEERFSAPVRVRVMATGLRPSHAEVDLTAWRSDQELADREAIAAAAAGMLDALTVTQRPDDAEAYALLIELAPDYLKEWTRRDGLAVERYYRNAFGSRGDVRKDRRTTPMLGSLFTQENARRLIEISSRGLRSTKHATDAFFWVVPQVPLWGTTSILPDIIDQTHERVVRTNEDLLQRKPVEAVALTAGQPQRWVREAFSRCQQSEARVFPNSFELLVVPGAFAAAVVHAPIGQKTGLAVPLGFASFDADVVARASDLVSRHAAQFRLPEPLMGALAPVELVAPSNGETQET